MTDAPPPLVPSDIDLAGLDGFILHVNRLLSSDLVAMATPEALGVAVTLWCRAWQQRCSLPDDEAQLARISGAGRRWKVVREMALRGFIRCSDGRLYHPVLAEEALRAWKKRCEYRAQRDAARSRMESLRKNRGGKVVNLKPS